VINPVRGPPPGQLIGLPLITAIWGQGGNQPGTAAGAPPLARLGRQTAEDQQRGVVGAGLRPGKRGHRRVICHTCATARAHDRKGPHRDRNRAGRLATSNSSGAARCRVQPVSKSPAAEQAHIAGRSQRRARQVPASRPRCPHTAWHGAPRGHGTSQMLPPALPPFPPAATGPPINRQRCRHRP